MLLNMAARNQSSSPPELSWVERTISWASPTLSLAVSASLLAYFLQLQIWSDQGMLFIQYQPRFFFEVVYLINLSPENSATIPISRGITNLQQLPRLDMTSPIFRFILCIHWKLIFLVVDLMIQGVYVHSSHMFSFSSSFFFGHPGIDVFVISWWLEYLICIYIILHCFRMFYFALCCWARNYRFGGGFFLPQNNTFFTLNPAFQLHHKYYPFSIRSPRFNFLFLELVPFSIPSLLYHGTVYVFCRMFVPFHLALTQTGTQ